MATWHELDKAVGQLKIQLVLTEQDPDRCAHWYGLVTREIGRLTERLQKANQQARYPGELDAIGIAPRPTGCTCPPPEPGQITARADCPHHAHLAAEAGPPPTAATNAQNTTSPSEPETP